MSAAKPLREQGAEHVSPSSCLAPGGSGLPYARCRFPPFTSVANRLRREPKQMSGLAVFLLLTMFVSTPTLGTGRTTRLQGVVHLGILAMFLLISAVP